jgi:two-component system sensor histidine kinase KdpD
MSRRRLFAGFVIAVAGLPLLTLAAHAAGVALTGAVPLFLAAVVGVALAGGLWPALLAAVGGFLLLNYYFVPPLHTLAIDTGSNLLALAAFVVVALAVSWVVDLAARRTRQAHAFAAEAQTLAVAAAGDRVRTELLRAVGHDLRTPLASAKAAIAGLRSPEVDFGDDDRAELLATADESLDRLAGLVANLLDMSRLQAGTLGLTPADVGLEEVLPRALDELGAGGRRFVLRLPDDLPAVRADPGLLERVLVNLAGNALRFSPADRPPSVAGSARGDMVCLTIVDHGPGIPEEQWEQVFRPFQRLDDRSAHDGVGLGLALSRGLTEAMGGTLRPAATPGGGLTMILSLPAAPIGSP